MPATKEQSEIPTVDFHYRRSAHYRTVRTDGVYGGLSPHSEIQIDFYGDYAPHPEMITQEVSKDGVLGKETGRIQHRGIVREIEFTTTMSVATAEVLVVWLQEKIAWAKGERGPEGGR